jgi:hypothetical protein
MKKVESLNKKIALVLMMALSGASAVTSQNRLAGVITKPAKQQVLPDEQKPSDANPIRSRVELAKMKAMENAKKGKGAGTPSQDVPKDGAKPPVSATTQQVVNLQNEVAALQQELSVAEAGYQRSLTLLARYKAENAKYVENKTKQDQELKELRELEGEYTTLMSDLVAAFSTVPGDANSVDPLFELAAKHVIVFDESERDEFNKKEASDKRNTLVSTLPLLGMIEQAALAQQAKKVDQIDPANQGKQDAQATAQVNRPVNSMLDQYEKDLQEFSEESGGDKKFDGQAKQAEQANGEAGQDAPDPKVAALRKKLKDGQDLAKKLASSADPLLQVLSMDTEVNEFATGDFDSVNDTDIQVKVKALDALVTKLASAISAMNTKEGEMDDLLQRYSKLTDEGKKEPKNNDYNTYVDSVNKVGIDTTRMGLNAEAGKKLESMNTIKQTITDLKNLTDNEELQQFIKIPVDSKE